MWLADRMCMLAARTQGLITDFLLVFLVRWGLKDMGLGYVRFNELLSVEFPPTEPSGPAQMMLYGSIYFTSGLPELVLAGMWFVYAVVFLAAFGQTLGMQWVGVRLVDSRGMRPSIWRVILRQVFWPLSSPYWAGYLIAWVTPQAAVLHDLISGTRVEYAGRDKRMNTEASSQASDE